MTSWARMLDRWERTKDRILAESDFIACDLKHVVIIADSVIGSCSCQLSTLK
jgi:hypothetical protein